MGTMVSSDEPTAAPVIPYFAEEVSFSGEILVVSLMRVLLELVESVELVCGVVGVQAIIKKSTIINSITINAIFFI